MIDSIESILRDFKIAKNPKRQIKIIAQLNCEPPSLIERILREELGDKEVTRIIGRQALSADARPSTKFTYRQSLEKEKSEVQYREARQALIKRSNSRKIAKQLLAGEKEMDSEIKDVEEQEKDSEIKEYVAEKPVAEKPVARRLYRNLNKEERNNLYEAIKNGATYQEFIALALFEDNATSHTCYNNIKQKIKRSAAEDKAPKQTAEEDKTPSQTAAEDKEQASKEKYLDTASVYPQLLGKLPELTSEQQANVLNKLNSLADLDKSISLLLNLRTGLLNEINNCLVSK